MGSDGSPLKSRPPIFAGSFYPGNREALLKELDVFFNSVENEQISEKIWGLIAPHAGYMYSGQVAAEAYNQVKGRKYDTVIVVAPSHREHFTGASIYNGDEYHTPLGSIEINKEMAKECSDSDTGVYLSEKGHGEEHSLEVQLPFLQYAIEGFKLVPIVMCDQSYEMCTNLGLILGKILKQSDDVLLVGSTDLSHFYDYDTAAALDKHIVDRVGKLDQEGLSRDIEQRKSEACGAGPMITVMYAAKLAGATYSKVLSYKNSGDVTGDRTKVVGYMSALFYGN